VTIILQLHAFFLTYRALNFSDVIFRWIRKKSLPLPRYYRIIFTVPTVLP